MLLANYFLWLDQSHGSPDTGWDVYIALGQGLPEGDTVYVLRMARTEDRVELWNAATVHALLCCATLDAPLHLLLHHLISRSFSCGCGGGAAVSGSFVSVHR